MVIHSIHFQSYTVEELISHLNNCTAKPSDTTACVFDTFACHFQYMTVKQMYRIFKSQMQEYNISGGKSVIVVDVARKSMRRQFI